MIRMIGNHICKDCVSAMEVIQRERLPIEFHDMEKALDYVKEFLEIREGNPDYRRALGKSMTLSSGMKVELGDTLRANKNNLLVLLTLCSRAAIEGGLNPSTAYTLSLIHI